MKKSRKLKDPVKANSDTSHDHESETNDSDPQQLTDNVHTPLKGENGKDIPQKNQKRENKGFSDASTQTTTTVPKSILKKVHDIMVENEQPPNPQNKPVTSDEKKISDTQEYEYPQEYPEEFEEPSNSQNRTVTFADNKHSDHQESKLEGHASNETDQEYQEILNVLEAKFQNFEVNEETTTEILGQFQDILILIPDALIRLQSLMQILMGKIREQSDGGFLSKILSKSYKRGSSRGPMILPGTVFSPLIDNYGDTKELTKLDKTLPSNILILEKMNYLLKKPQPVLDEMYELVAKYKGDCHIWCQNSMYQDLELEECFHLLNDDYNTNQMTSHSGHSLNSPQFRNFKGGASQSYPFNGFDGNLIRKQGAPLSNWSQTTTFNPLYEHQQQEPSTSMYSGPSNEMSNSEVEINHEDHESVQNTPLKIQKKSSMVNRRPNSLDGQSGTTSDEGSYSDNETLTNEVYPIYFSNNLEQQETHSNHPNNQNGADIGQEANENGETPSNRDESMHA